MRESAKINAIDTYGPTGSVTWERDENGVPYAQKVDVSPVMDDTLGRQELIGNSLTRIAGARTMGIPTEDFSLDGIQYNTRKIDTNQFSPLGDIRGDMPYDPRNMSADLEQFNRSRLPKDPRYFKTDQFQQFDGSAEGGPNAPGSFDTSQLRGPGNISDRGPYSPGDQQVNMDSYQDVRNQGPYQTGKQRTNVQGFKPGDLPEGTENFDIGQFQSFDAQAGKGKYGINSFDVAQEFGDYSDDRGSMVYDPRKQRVNINQYEDQRGEMPFDPRARGDLDQYNREVQDAYMSEQRRNLDPVFEQQFNRQLQNLADRGLPIDGEAYKTAMANMSREQANAYQGASNQAILAGGAEAQRRLEMERGVRSDAMSESYAVNDQQNKNEQLRLDAQGKLRDQAFSEDSQAFTLDQENARARLEAQNAMRGQLWSELDTQNQRANQSTQQMFDAQKSMRDSAFQEDIATNQQTNAAMQQRFEQEQQIRSAYMDENYQANQLQNQSEANRLNAQSNLQNQYFDQNTRQYELGQQALMNQSDVGMRQRDQYWNESVQANQLQNQNTQQLMDAQLKLRGAAFQEDMLTNTQRNQVSAQEQAAQMGIRNAAMGEAQSMHAQDFSDAQQKLQIEQNIRGQQIQERLMERNQNANETAQLLGAAPSMPVPAANQMPNYQLQSTDVIGAHMGAYNAAMQGYNAQQNAAGSAWQGAANIAGGIGGAMKSSKTFKHDDGDPGSILEKLADIPVRTWRYRREIDPREEVHIGPYAEDWKRVLGFGNGREIMPVDAIGVALKCIQELYAEIGDLKDQVASLKRRRK